MNRQRVLRLVAQLGAMLAVVTLLLAPVVAAPLRIQVSRARIPAHLHLRRDVALGTKRNLQAADPDSVAVYGDFRRLAYFYVDVYLGTPPQKATVVADTGSSLLAVPCAGCQHCGTHSDPLFDTSRSSTAKMITRSDPGDLTCEACTSGSSGDACCYTVRYTEGSTLQGTYFNDSCWLGSDGDSEAEGLARGIDYQFGCHNLENGLFTNQYADGIIGLSAGDNNIVTKMAEAGKLDHNLFSLCLTPTGGLMQLGGVDEELHRQEMQFTPFTTDMFRVHITSMEVAGTSVYNGMMSVIVDSGTSFTYLPTAVATAVHNAVVTYCEEDTHCRGTVTEVPGELLCYTLRSSHMLDTFPSLNISLPGATISMSPRAMFLNMVWMPADAYCLGIADAGSTAPVLGANAMFFYDVAFDMEGGKVGFAPVGTACQPPDTSLLPIHFGKAAMMLLLVVVVVSGGMVTWLINRRRKPSGFQQLQESHSHPAPAVIGEQLSGTVAEGASVVELRRWSAEHNLEPPRLGTVQVKEPQESSGAQDATPEAALAVDEVALEVNLDRHFRRSSVDSSTG